MIQKPLETVRIAFIGCGVISNNHMRYYTQMDNVKVVAACDIDRPRLEAWCKHVHGLPRNAEA